jgi:hypothetical protein
MCLVLPGLVCAAFVFVPKQRRSHWSDCKAIRLDFITNLKLADEDAPAVVQGCVLRRGKIGIGVIGAPATSRRIVIRQNTVADFSQGIFLSGSLQQLQIVGNRIYGFSVSGIQPQQLAKETEGVLIANNTLFDGSNAFRLWDNAVKGKNIQVCNNLVLGRPYEADMVFTDSGGDAFIPRGPGDGKLLRDAWQLHHNWRELKPDKSWDKDWIPLGKGDITAEPIAVLSRQRDDLNFLRPAADSPLATAGAGKVDPSLPGYVGAVPPAGAPAWDWMRTWQAWPPGSLLTVSKEASGGGTYRTIGAALGAAKPWTTIRVLDAATYSERLVLDNAARHEGIVLEAPGRATLEMGPRSLGFLTIKGVPNVRVRGFRFRQAKANVGSVFLTVTGHCPGVVLEELELQGDGDAAVYGIALFNVQNESHEAPLVVQRCTVLRSCQRCRDFSCQQRHPDAGKSSERSHARHPVTRKGRSSAGIRQPSLELYAGGLTSSGPGLNFPIDLVQRQYCVR